MTAEKAKKPRKLRAKKPHSPILEPFQPIPPRDLKREAYETLREALLRGVGPPERDRLRRQYQIDRGWIGG